MSYYSKNDGCVEWAFGLLFLVGVGSGIQSSFFPGVNPLLFFVCFILVITGIPYAFGMTCEWLGKRKAERENFNLMKQKCVHGIEGGQIANLCPECAAEKLRTQAKEKRRLEIKEMYNQVKLEEQDRINKFYIQQEAYIRNELSPFQFEDLVSNLFRDLGYEVNQTPYVNDGGKDAYMKKDGKIYLLECKHYASTNSIGRPDLQKFYAAMTDCKAVQGYYVNLGRFTSSAIQYATIHSIILIEMVKLLEMMQSTYGNNDVCDCCVVCLECGEIVKFPLDETITEGICKCGNKVDNYFYEIKKYRIKPVKGFCPKCGKRLKVVHGRRGKFLGCTGYPCCRYTENYTPSSKSRIIFCGTPFIEDKEKH